MDKSKLRDGRGRPLTQSLFLEVGYNTDFAVYTQKDEDYTYKGKLYLSLKRLYLEHEDPTEYDFATTHLLGWQHWQRIVRNKVFAKMVEEWREELELKLRSQAFREILDQSSTDKGFQAAKWIADKGWNKRAAGRPSNEDIARETKIQANINEEYNADVVRLINE
jgi:hypothetical protein